MSEPNDELSFTWCGELRDDVRSDFGNLIRSVVTFDDSIGFTSPIDPGALEAYLDGLRLDLQLGRKTLLLIRRTDALRGAVVLAFNGHPNQAHLVECQKCMVHPDGRGQGIPWAAVPVVLRLCRERGIEILTLDVRKGTRAEKLWERMGFVPFGELPDYARIEGTRCAGVWMWATVEEIEKRLRKISGARQ